MPPTHRSANQAGAHSQGAQVLSRLREARAAYDASEAERYGGGVDTLEEAAPRHIKVEERTEISRVNSP
jgi:hypothetical protein